MSQESSPNSVDGQLQEMDTIAAGTRAVLKVEANNEKMLDELFNLRSNSHLNSKPLKERGGLPSSLWKNDSSNSKQLCRQLLSSNTHAPFTFDNVSPNLTPFPQSNTGTTPFPSSTPFPGTTSFPGSTQFPGTTPFPGASTSSQPHYK